MSDTFETPWVLAHQTPLSMGFPRQEYWSGLPLPSPENVISYLGKISGPFFILHCEWGTVQGLCDYHLCFLFLQVQVLLKTLKWGNPEIIDQFSFVLSWVILSDIGQFSLVFCLLYNVISGLYFWISLFFLLRDNWQGLPWWSCG